METLSIPYIYCMCKGVRYTVLVGCYMLGCDVCSTFIRLYLNLRFAHVVFVLSKSLAKQLGAVVLYSV